MKVLHLYAGNLFGGIETFLVTMARLRRLAPDVEPMFGLAFRGRLWDELEATGARVDDLGAVRLSRVWTVWRARARLEHLIEKTGPDWIITHDPWPHAVFAPVARRMGVPLAHLVHSTSSHASLLLRLATLTRPDITIANSRFTASWAANAFRSSDVEIWRLPVVPSDYPHHERHCIRSEIGTASGAVVILQSSRLERWKGHAIHLRAMGMLANVPGWELWVAGGVQKKREAAYLGELRALADRAGIADRVRFLGQRTDLPRLMAAADIYCQPNTGPEPFGIAFIEALYARLPVITSDFGGAAEIVDKTCGLLTRPGDPAAVAAALRRLINDHALRRALGAAGPDRARAISDCARQLNALSALLGGREHEFERGRGPIATRIQHKGGPVIVSDTTARWSISTGSTTPPSNGKEER